ncbi:MAG: hypothetical protein RIR39_976 [Pseudomonadota bacterium]
MFEVLFIFTVIFVAYVVYSTVNEQKATPKPSSEPKVKPEAPKVVIEQPAPVPKIAAKIKKPAPIKKTASTTVTKNTVKKGLRDPKTGEIATTYNNYRFTKRWIKDALVTEGLLEKVYKNNELNSAIEATIKDAVIKLEAIEKYKP